MVLCINYPDVLNEDSFFSYDIVSEQLETIDERIDGKNKLIEPIIVDNLKSEHQYSIAVGLYEKNGSHNVIKGTIEFNDNDRKIEFSFKGNHSVVVFKGYRIGD